jgi:hypothetical protein
MSKADTRSTPIPSRRAVLAGIAATPALAAAPALAIPALTEPDPIFPVIERVRRAELACDSIDVDTASEGSCAAAAADFWQARSAFARTVPTTPAGVAAFASYLHEAQTRMCNANPYLEDVEDAEAFAATLDVAVSRAFGFQPWKTQKKVHASVKPDPIFAAIERCKASNVATLQFLKLKDKFEDEHGRVRASAEHDEWQRREDDACDAESSAIAEMVATVPTTIAGVMALLRYVDEEHARGNKILYDETFEGLISTIVSALDTIGAAS